MFGEYNKENRLFVSFNESVQKALELGKNGPLDNEILKNLESQINTIVIASEASEAFSPAQAETDYQIEHVEEPVQIQAAPKRGRKPSIQAVEPQTRVITRKRKEENPPLMQAYFFFNSSVTSLTNTWEKAVSEGRKNQADACTSIAIQIHGARHDLERKLKWGLEYLDAS